MWKYFTLSGGEEIPQGKDGVIAGDEEFPTANLCSNATFSFSSFSCCWNLYVSIWSPLQLKALVTVNIDMKVILYTENAIKIVLR